MPVEGARTGLFSPRRYTRRSMDDGPPLDGEALLRRAHAAGVEPFGVGALTFDAYAAAAEARVRDRLDALGLEATPERHASTRARLCLQDLVLVVA